MIESFRSCRAAATALPAASELFFLICIACCTSGSSSVSLSTTSVPVALLAAKASCSFYEVDLIRKKSKPHESAETG